MTADPKPETVVLPRSRVVLTRTGKVVQSVMIGGIVPVALIDPASGTWAQCGSAELLNASRDECIAWLDARVLALRSALLADSEEIIARELYAIRCRSDDDPEEFTEAHPDLQELFREDAQAVLRALGVSP